ncbi:MAG TPA: ATP-binding protein [Methanomassiliicoccaceae archaeon]|jgi:DNA helicase HerA-like ATPase|nr:ATP-binding protein [Methanomassiliicoccaceae archaeon]HOQ25243.1 ATP-binding protein [Methanomassiliicoccaceae archaeon]HPT73872.1 ATP-binding protein [Methanomassiliicoccaceae archaeon]HQA20584.1 ATP-binding protein [Methanomassiliicoccaceae archaeon]HQD87102.1 ATP-binding protein [Methanomassiliicoccaceae archaeon]
MDTEADVPAPGEEARLEPQPPGTDESQQAAVEALDLPASEPMGMIYGNVGTSSFNVWVTGSLEKMDYIQVEHDSSGWVLGQIMEMERRTDLSIEKAKRVLNGEDLDIEEKVTASVNIVGYRDDRGLLQSPRTPFRAGQMVFRATDELIKEVIGLKEHTSTGAYIGLLAGHNIRVEVDINSMVQKHVCILAKTGGGKSFMCGDLIEELMKHDVTIMVIDPHGEYGSMREKGRIPPGGRDFGVEPRGYADKIIEFATDTSANPLARPLKFTLANIEPRDLLALTSIKNGRAYLTPLRKAVDLIKNVKRDYSLRDIIKVLEAEEEGGNAALISELEYLDEINIFAESGTRIDELVLKGKMTIVNLKGTPPDIAELVVERICSALFELRKLDRIPPMMLVVEEAHNFCPQVGTAASSKIFRTIAAEGRKFGLGLTIISQRAAKVDKSVLSQCNTQMILKVTNPNDLKAITASVEGLTAGMADEIQRLPIGVALVVGGNVQMPLFVEVRPRESRHGGESVQIVSDDDAPGDDVEMEEEEL